MPKLSHFAFYPGDWLNSHEVTALSFELQGVYFRVLCLMWTAKDGTCSLPLDAYLMARLLHVNPRTWRKWYEQLKHLFIIDFAAGTFTQERIQKERTKAITAWERACKAREAKEAAIRAKFGGHSQVIRGSFDQHSTEIHPPNGGTNSAYSKESGTESQPTNRTEQNRTETTREKSVAGKPATRIEPSAEALDVAAYLANAILSHSPGARLKPSGWARDVDLAIRIDNRTPEDLRRCIDVAHRSSDPFWRSNLLSGKKLREHADRLLIKANQGTNTGPPGTRGMSVRDLLDASEKLREKGA